MQDKIIAAIAAYLEMETGFSEDYRKVTFAKRLPAKMGKDEFCKNRAAEIATAIAPLVEAKDYPYNELFNHMANEHGLTLTNTYLGDIIHIARGK